MVLQSKLLNGKRNGLKLKDMILNQKIFELNTINKGLINLKKYHRDKKTKISYVPQNEERK